MARVNLDEADKYVGGGSSFFKLEDGQKKTVRFLFDNITEVKSSALVVHEFTGSKFATIDCCRGAGDPADACKWCSMGNNAVMRVVLPMYVVEDQEIQYWKKSGSFVKDTLIPLFDNLPTNAPIAGQEFILSRTGKTMRDTKYSCAPNMRVQNDMRTKDQFGEIKDPFEINIIKPNDYDFDPQAEAQANEAPAQATRRTAEVF